MWLLGIELRTFGRAGNALNHWAISPALALAFWDRISLCRRLILNLWQSSYLWLSCAGIKSMCFCANFSFYVCMYVCTYICSVCVYLRVPWYACWRDVSRPLVSLPFPFPPPFLITEISSEKVVSSWGLPQHILCFHVYGSFACMHTRHTRIQCLHAHGAHMHTVPAVTRHQISWNWSGCELLSTYGEPNPGRAAGVCNSWTISPALRHCFLHKI